MRDEQYALEQFAKVQKRKGYRWPGVIVARFHTLRGRARYVVECSAPAARGALHIFSATDLRRRTGR